MKSAPNDMADSRTYEFWRHCIGQTVMLSHPITHGIDFHWPVRETHSENLPLFGNRETQWTIAQKSRLIGAFRLMSVT